MQTHHRIAVPLAALIAASLLLDTAVLVVTGHRTFITDDARGNAAQSIGMTLLLGATLASLAFVVFREADRFAGANRVARATRRPLLAGLTLFATGSLTISPLVGALGLESGPLYNVSSLFAALALLLTFLPALVLGLAVLKDHALGIGGRVLGLMVPVGVLTAGLALVAPDVASPVLLTGLVVVGVSLIGVGGRSREGRRTPAPSLP